MSEEDFYNNGCPYHDVIPVPSDEQAKKELEVAFKKADKRFAAAMKDLCPEHSTPLNAVFLYDCILKDVMRNGAHAIRELEELQKKG